MNGVNNLCLPTKYKKSRAKYLERNNRLDTGGNITVAAALLFVCLFVYVVGLDTGGNSILAASLIFSIFT